MSQTQQKNQKSVHQATQTAKAVTNGNFIYLTLLSLIMLLAPYAHLIYYGDSDIKGDFFNFRWMSSFLFALALPCFMCATGLMLRYFAKKYNERSLKLLSFIVLISGSFYLAWTFWTTPSDFKDISKEVYIILLLALSLVFYFLLKAFEILALKTEKQVHRSIKAIHYFFYVLYEDLESKELINPWKKNEFNSYKVDVTDKILDIENDAKQ